MKDGPVLVTGASGFIGGRLVEVLSGSTELIGFGRIAPNRLPPGVTWRFGDVRSLADLEAATASCTAVVHLAASPLWASFADPFTDFTINAVGTLNVLEAARRREVGRVVFASTAHVYGDCWQPARESDQPRPGSPYAASKLAAEAVCDGYRGAYGMSILSMRLANVYGVSAGLTRDTVESLFVAAANRGESPVVIGDPSQCRDFLYLEDAVEAFRLAIVARVNGTLNIGSGVATTFENLARMALELAARDLEPEFKPDSSPPFRVKLDATRAELELGFRAAVPIESGLRRLLEYDRLHCGAIK